MGKKKIKVTPKWLRHEALHTSSVCMEMVQDHLLEHQYYEQKINPEFNKHIDQAFDALFKAYQSVNKENEVKKKMKIDRY